MNALTYGFRRAVSGLLYKRVYRYFNPKTPRLAPGANAALSRFLTKESQVLEWGSGLSTVWLAERCGNIVSIEHDPEWYQRVIQLLDEAGLTNARVILQEPDKAAGDSFDWQSWRGIKLVGTPAKPKFVNYFHAAEDLADDSFDLVILDGRGRTACFPHAMTKVKPGGWLLLDDSARPGYTPIFDAIGNWPHKTYRMGLIETTIFTRPSETSVDELGACSMQDSISEMNR